jgi:methylated-DNA-[protein]-cysteine S-methyltransferase
MTARYTFVPAPFGELLLVSADAASLTRVWLPPATAPTDAVRDDALPVFVAARTQLAEYFAGTRTTFDLPLDPRGTAFQRQVWDALRAIPYGSTKSYGQIADEIGAPGAARAVGAANHDNPLAIVVPCHRVLGADGSLVGFAGGLAQKRALLDLEAGMQALPL